MNAKETIINFHPYCKDIVTSSPIVRADKKDTKNIKEESNVTLRNSLSASFIVSVKVRIFPLNMGDIIIYVARWWEKYLSKRIPLKHSCSWRDKLIVLWILNREAKIFLRTREFFKDCVLACKIGNQMHTRFKETKVTPGANGSFAPKWLFCKTWFLYNIYSIIWSKNF